MKLLNFLNLLDHSGKLSITNVVVYAILIKVALGPATMPEVAALFLALANYCHKRVVSAKSSISTQPEPGLSEIEQIKNTVSALSLAVGMKSIKQDKK